MDEMWSSANVYEAIADSFGNPYYSIVSIKGKMSPGPTSVLNSMHHREEFLDAIPPFHKRQLKMDIAPDKVCYHNKWLHRAKYTGQGGR